MLSFAAKRLGALVPIALAVPCWCADLQVSPVLLQFASSERAQALWLTNTGSKPLTAQIRAYRWSQTEEEDRLDRTQALVASPPLVSIAAGQSQLVRIVRKQRAPVEREESFRVIVDELPSSGRSATAVGGDIADGSTNGLRLLLRYSIPAFVEGERPAGGPAATDISSDWMGGERPALTIMNRWTRRLRISQLIHEDAAGRRTTIVPGLLGYVLAGQRRRFELPPSATALGPGVIKARLYESLDEFPLTTIARGP